MFKKIVTGMLISCFIVFITFPCETLSQETQKEYKMIPLTMNPKGRYQIFYYTVNDFPVRIFLFDTETGKIWMNESPQLIHINPDLWKKVSPQDLTDH